MKKIIVSLICLAVGSTALVGKELDYNTLIYDVEANGICYYLNDDLTLSVAPKDVISWDDVDGWSLPTPYYAISTRPTRFYTGDVKIPSEVYVESLDKTLPVTSVGFGAFNYCPDLLSVEIPSTVTKIDTFGFYMCTGLESVNIEGESLTSISTGAFIGCTSLTDIKLPSSFKGLGCGAFGNSGLTSITLPSGFNFFNYNVFGGCGNLKKVTCLVKDPASIGSIEGMEFKIPGNVILEVPKGSQHLYREDPRWSGFKTIIGIDTGAGSSDDHEYVPTVREDRYWIYNYHGGGSMAYPDETNILIRSEFDGMEEINGVTYHRFVTTSLESNIQFPVYLLREEEGVVYLWLSSFLKPWLSYDEDGVMMEEHLKDKTELILYDFTKSKSEGYKAIRMSGALYEGLHYPSGHYGEAFYIVDTQHNIIDTGTVEINGELCKSVTITAPSHSRIGRTYIEGVGLIPDLSENMRFEANFDFLTYQEFDVMCNHFINQYQCHLVGVYDKEDNLIYAGRLDLGVEGLPDDDKLAGVQSPVYFNLQGQPVSNPEKGNLYIERTSAGARKILF